MANTVSEKDSRIKELEKEVQKMKDILSSSGAQSSELQKQLSDTQESLREAQDKIKRLEL